MVNDEAQVTLDGLTITGGSGSEAGGVQSGGALVTIHNCLIHHNQANGAPNSWGGGGVLASGNLTSSSSLIIQNVVRQGGSGIRVGEGLLRLSNSLVADNAGDMAVHLNGPADVQNSTIANNTGGALVNPPVTATLKMTNSIL